VGRRLTIVLFACLVAPALALAATGDPREAFTTADQAKAKSMLLVRTDLSAGWKRTSTPDTGADLSCPGFDPDLSDLTLTGEKKSEFSHPSFGYVAGFVSVYRTDANARTEFARVAKPALARCLGLFFKEGVVQAGGTVTIVKQGQVAFPKVAERVAAYRVVCRVGSPGSTQKTQFTVDLIILGRGRGEVVMLAVAAGTGIVQADQRSLARLLASRMQKAGV
jgi:hypothetical protein